MVDGLVGGRVVWLVGFVWFGFVWFGLVGWLIGWASEIFQNLPKFVQSGVQNRSKNLILWVPEALGPQDGPSMDLDGCTISNGRFAPKLGPSWSHVAIEIHFEVG